MAFGPGTITDISGAVSDLFASSADSSKAQGLRLKAQGDAIEGQDYDLAGSLAGQNEQFAAQSTAIKQAQTDRQIYQTIGGQQADIAGAGLSASGSSLDLLRDSASQGALTKAVAGQQGLITEAGYTEQQQSYQNLSKAAGVAVQEDDLAANAADQAAKGANVNAIFKGVSAVASLFTGGSSDLLTNLVGGAGGSGDFTPTTPESGNPLVIDRYGTPGPASSSPSNPATPLGALY